MLWTRDRDRFDRKTNRNALDLAAAAIRSACAIPPQQSGGLRLDGSLLKQVRLSGAPEVSNRRARLICVHIEHEI